MSLLCVCVCVHEPSNITEKSCEPVASQNVPSRSHNAPDWSYAKHKAYKLILLYYYTAVWVGEVSFDS